MAEAVGDLSDSGQIFMFSSSLFWGAAFLSGNEAVLRGYLICFAESMDKEEVRKICGQIQEEQKKTDPQIHDTLVKGQQTV